MFVYSVSVLFEVLFVIGYPERYKALFYKHDTKKGVKTLSDAAEVRFQAA